MRSDCSQGILSDDADVYEAEVTAERQSCLPFVLVADRDIERYQGCHWVLVEQEASADGALERATLVLAKDAAVAVVNTDMLGAQGLVVNLQSYWLPASQSGSGSI